jgi:predicted dienelactone hydrolase
MAFTKPAVAQTNVASDTSAAMLADGPYKVSLVSDIILHDAKRNKDLPLNVLYPAATGSGALPVIIFSHGAGGSKDGYQEWTHHWASYGYVVIQPTHEDSIALQRAQGKHPGGLRQNTEVAVSDVQAWQDRPRDISFVIDSFGELERKVPQLKNKLDATRIGVGGHSYGAYTAQAIGGATIILPGKTEPMSLADKRVKAVLMMSPQGAGEMGLTRDSWKNFTLPMMVMTGSLDRGLKKQAPEWRKEPFNRAASPEKYCVFIDGATHMSFSGNLRTFGQKQIFDYIQLASFEFWNAYLKDDRAARAYLKSDSLQKFSNGAATVDRKQ